MNDFSRKIQQLLTAGLVGVIIAINTKVNAGIQFDIAGTANFYFGAGLGWNKYLISNDFSRAVQAGSNRGSVSSTGLNMLTPLLGVEINNKYALEVGYSIYRNLKFAGGRTGGLGLRNYFLDFIRLVSLESYPIDLFAGIGIGRMHVKEKTSGPSIISGYGYNKFGFRIKGGIRYIIDPNWNVRGMLTYQRVGDRGIKGAIKTIRSIGVDCIYLI